MSKPIQVLLQMIKNGEIKLPDLQRDFVWDESQVRELLDSILRGYPFGYLLLWNTQFIKVWYRDFTDSFVDGMTYTPKQKPEETRILMVLDGQQRLQSLYLTMFGSFNGKFVYFDVTSDPMVSYEDKGDRAYLFQFRTDSDVSRPKSLIKVMDILNWAPRFEDQEIKKVVTDIGDSEAVSDRIGKNLRLLRRTFSSEMIPIVTIDENVMNKDQIRSTKEILDIFVRINSGGTRLTQSDLMFSLIKTQWTDARTKFDTLIKEINTSGFEVNIDFLIRGLQMISDSPTHFDVEIIEKHWSKMQSYFETLSSALKATLDFCRTPEMRLFSESMLSPISTILPIVYYLKDFPNCSVPDGDRKMIKAFIFFLLYNNFLGGKNPAARLRYLRDVFINPKNKAAFPINDLLNQIACRQTNHKIVVDDELLNWNKKLSLCIALPQAAKETLSWQERAEVDHIFPQSVYRPKYGSLVDDIGNLAFLGKLRNIRKNDQEPSDYFKNISKTELETEFYIDSLDDLIPSNFQSFVENRRKKILTTVKEFLNY